MNDLALEIGQLHGVVVAEHQVADAGCGEIHRHRRPEAAEPDHEHPRRAQPFLSALADLAKPHVAAVASGESFVHPPILPWDPSRLRRGSERDRAPLRRRASAFGRRSPRHDRTGFDAAPSGHECATAGNPSRSRTSLRRDVPGQSSPARFRPPARSRIVSTFRRPDRESRSRTAGPWSRPCSMASQPPRASRAGAWRASVSSTSSPAGPAASASRGSNRTSPVARCGSLCAT